MFIAMNRFKVLLDAGAAFEEVWTSRDTHLRGVPGFVSFHLLRGPAREDHVLYSSHTIWRDKTAFEDWTTSEAFRQAHRNAGGNRPTETLKTLPGVTGLHKPGFNGPCHG